MNESEKPTSSVIILGIAWLQFLTMAAVIDKPDMRNVSSAWKQGINSPFIWTWDWTKFGGVSIALVVVAVCFLSLPALLSAFGDSNSGSLPDYMRPCMAMMVKIGFFAWLFSFLTFVGYLNSLCVSLLYVSLAIVIAMAWFFKKTAKDKT
jgi:hypothetical protein